jgi:DNA-binding response OmpR family regulator
MLTRGTHRKHPARTRGAPERERLQLDTSRRIAIVGDRDIRLRPKEFELLSALAAHRGDVVERDHLLRLVWGYQVPVKTRTLDMHVRNVRVKLAGTGLCIETERGVGYRLTDCPIC